MIDAAGKGRGRKRPSYKIPRTPQLTGRLAGKRKPADRVEGRVPVASALGELSGLVQKGVAVEPNNG